MSGIHKSKIEWCDSTWNPVSGCLHGCAYCYAARNVRRFQPQAGEWPEEGNLLAAPHDPRCFIATAPTPLRDADGKYLRSTPYPKGFAPTMRRYILDHLKSAKTPRLIFVGSMCDLFGEWVSDEWLDTIFAACHAAPQHVYIFLTKNPTRYVDLAQKGLLPGRDNFWYGTSTPTDETPYFWAEGFNTFVSIEPLLAPFENCQNDDPLPVNWVIIGAMTGPGARKNQPRREWLENIEANCRANNTPVFMKNSLAGIWGEPLPQEWPEAMLKHIGRGTEAGL